MIRTFRQAGLLALLTALAGCGAIRIEPQKQLPPPLIEKLPATVAIYYPAEFRAYTHKEQRNQVDYEVALGAAHVLKLSRLLQAMFTRVIEVDDPAQARAADASVAMVLEPRFEDYAFLTPRDMAGDFYTVTIRYRLNVYNPRGERVDGYVFTGYGRQKTSAMSTTEPLVRATERAMRDAGAKLAVELPGQETVRRLLAGDMVVPQRTREDEVQEALGSFGSGPAAAPAPVGESEQRDTAAGESPEAGPAAEASPAEPPPSDEGPAEESGTDPEPAVEPAASP